MKAKIKNFTLIELMFVMAVIMILASLSFPALQQAKFRARYVRWFAYNAALSADPEVVLNCNFQLPDFTVAAPSGTVEAVRNSAAGCSHPKFDIKMYQPLFENGPEWFRTGRWRRHNTSLQFDGFNDYLRVPGVEATALPAGQADFTVVGWVKFDVISGKEIQAIVSKSLWPDYASLILYAKGSKLVAEVGSVTVLESSGGILQPGVWTHVALVGEGNQYILYAGGKPARSDSRNSGRRILIWHEPQPGESKGQILLVDENGWNGHDVHGGDYVFTKDPDAYYEGKFRDQLGNAGLIIGAAGMMSGDPDLHMQGRIDEIIFTRKAWTPEMVKGHFEMGNPY